MGYINQFAKFIYIFKFYFKLDALRVARNGGPLPSARRISNAVQGLPSTDTPFSHMLPFWGQFLVHDIALTLEPDGSTSKIMILHFFDFILIWKFNLNCRSKFNHFAQILIQKC